MSSICPVGPANRAALLRSCGALGRHGGWATAMRVTKLKNAERLAEALMQRVETGLSMLCSEMSPCSGQERVVRAAGTARALDSALP